MFNLCKELDPALQVLSVSNYYDFISYIGQRVSQYREANETFKPKIVVPGKSLILPK